MSSSTLVHSLHHSKSAFERARQLMPGGVNSPVRAFGHVGGTPPFIQRAQGAYLYDVDGNRYIDYVGSWGPAIVGHAHPEVLQTLQETAKDGLSFGAPTVLENTMAQKVIDLVPSIEKVRFVNSGTEALLSAIRLARAFTGRSKIIKFSGCYHGHADGLLVKAGSGATTLGVPDSAGVPAATAQDTLTATFNSLDSIDALLTQHPNDIAAILVEPVAGNMGCIPPAPGFLQGLRERCDGRNMLLIFDEVMTGFRVALGGAQALYGVMPDITTLGKIIGGGMPCAAYGASLAIMATVAPEGPMYQAGTLSGNPLAMACGLKTLELLEAPGVYEALEKRTKTLIAGLSAIATQHGVAHTCTQVGSMFTLFFTDMPVTDYASALRSDKARFNPYFHAMLAGGVYLAPSPYEAGFVSLAHSDDDIQETLLVALQAMACC